jgi:DNA polymerase V
MPRGGYRKNAGRPKGQGKFGEETKPVRLPISMIDDVMTYIENKGYRLPLFGSKVQAGFPSPANDHMETAFDLNQHLVRSPASTFFVRVAGDSMLKAGIHPNDILVVDRSISPSHGKIVIAAVDGDLTVKRLLTQNGKTILFPENDDFPPIELIPENNVVIWGVVTNVVHSV